MKINLDLQAAYDMGMMSGWIGREDRHISNKADAKIRSEQSKMQTSISIERGQLDGRVETGFDVVKIKEFALGSPISRHCDCQSGKIIPNH